tara:strand:- start:93 stop:332 length:240 start_codon:yes stop_codon:yes gene_type:complete
MNQLIVLSDGWVICGYVAKELRDYHYLVENASVICRTGGTPWDDLCRGKGRDGATFRKWDAVTIGPMFVLSREWEGSLP